MNALPDPVSGRPRSVPPAAFAGESRLAADVLDELGRVIVGQRALLERMLIGLLATYCSRAYPASPRRSRSARSRRQ